jgi:arabinogalactan endo-1,4-beta-galactosidase
VPSTPVPSTPGGLAATGTSVPFGLAAAGLLALAAGAALIWRHRRR